MTRISTSAAHLPPVTPANVAPPTVEPKVQAADTAIDRLRPPSGSTMSIAAFGMVKNMKRANDLFSVFGAEKTLSPRTRDFLELEGIKDGAGIILSQEDLSKAVFEYDRFNQETQATVTQRAALVWDKDQPTRRSAANLGLADCKGLGGIKSVKLDGMEALSHLVLGPQPSEARLETLKAKAAEIGKKLAIVDLRAEFHFFVNGAPVSFFFPKHNCANAGKSAAEIESDAVKIKHKLQADLTKSLEAGMAIRFASKSKIKKEGNFETGPAIGDSETTSFEKIKVETPREFYGRHGVDYVFAPALDHAADTAEGIDACDRQLRELFAREGEENVLTYCHCAGGYGRTTGLGIREDLRKNADKFSSEEIATRQEEFRDMATASKKNVTYAPQWQEKGDVEFMYHLFRQKVPFSDGSKTFAGWLNDGAAKQAKLASA